MKACEICTTLFKIVYHPTGKCPKESEYVPYLEFRNFKEYPADYVESLDWFRKYLNSPFKN